jgi:hypothetical protein
VQFLLKKNQAKNDRFRKILVDRDIFLVDASNLQKCPTVTLRKHCLCERHNLNMMAAAVSIDTVLN